MNKDRISPDEVARLRESGAKVVMACAYDDDANFNRIAIDGSTSFSGLQAMLDALPKDQEVIFYCDCPHDELAVEKTAEFRKKGYNAKVLEGGVNAWRGQVG